MLSFRSEGSLQDSRVAAVVDIAAAYGHDVCVFTELLDIGACEGDTLVDVDQVVAHLAVNCAMQPVNDAAEHVSRSLAGYVFPGERIVREGPDMVPMPIVTAHTDTEGTTYHLADGSVLSWPHTWRAPVPYLSRVTVPRRP